MATRPSSKLASSVLPEPLYRALVHVFAFAQGVSGTGISGMMLVGGTAAEAKEVGRETDPRGAGVD